MYCINCGSELPEKAKFCLQCGTKIYSADTDDKSSFEGKSRKQVFDGEIKKCPHCGATIESFQTNCANCGYELRGQRANSFAESFAEGMNKIESEFANIKNDHSMEISLFKNDGKGFWSKYVDLANEEDKRIRQYEQYHNRKIQYIKNFPIPNSKEELYEFMIMASNNIDEDCFRYKKSLFGKELINNVKEDIELSKAWLSKMKMIYQKAKMSIKDSKDFAQIESIYNEIIEKTE